MIFRQCGGVRGIYGEGGDNLGMWILGPQLIKY